MRGLRILLTSYSTAVSGKSSGGGTEGSRSYGSEWYGLRRLACKALWTLRSGLGKIQAESDAIDALRHAIGTGVLGHQLPGALVGFRHEFLVAKEHKVSNDDGAWVTTAIELLCARVIGSGDAFPGVSFSFG